MTTVEQAAREAAEAYEEAEEWDDMDDTPDYHFASGYLAGHAAARAESETEIAALKQDCQTLEWSRAEEVAVRMAVEANNESLRAKLAEAEARHAEPCRECNGQGMIESVEMDHASGCTDSRCCSGCPVPVQRVEPCWACGGYGALMVPPVPLPEPETK